MKKKQWEPETLLTWTGEYRNKKSPAHGRLMHFTVMGRTRVVRCRILREKDYQRLLRLARKSKRTP